MKPFNPKLATWGPPVLLGIPLDHNSSFLRGAAQAPPLIREAFHSDHWNKTTETRVDLGAPGIFEDAGDLAVMESPDAFQRIEDAVAKIIEDGKRPISLGGDHSITAAILRAIGKRIPAITLVHFDAHPDLYADYEGNPHSHASPFARIMEEQLVHRLIQIGVRTMNTHQNDQAEKYAVRIFEIKDLPDPTHLNLAGPIYVSFDMDALDPAFAPGVSHWEPGGLTTREAISYIHALPGPIIGADLVEFNPVHD
ncbi:MAG TPA: agmatinase, partial [Candidatus Baltobacteraceae bacterium]|nr:agmatinase [Candidatus Baltobacteraceae bacterium]